MLSVLMTGDAFGLSRGKRKCIGGLFIFKLSVGMCGRISANWSENVVDAKA